jgi:hypothetical protein
MARPFCVAGDAAVSGGKIIPIIDAENRKQTAALQAMFNSDIAALINALDDMLMPLEQHIEELKQRVTKLEEAGGDL